MPREISKISWFFLWHGGDISCEVVGRRRRSPILGTVSVGHVPREISKISWFFLWHGGDISCEVVGRRRRSPILGKGLEVTCKYTFSGKPAFIKNLVNF